MRSLPGRTSHLLGSRGRLRRGGRVRNLTEKLFSGGEKLLWGERETEKGLKNSNVNHAGRQKKKKGHKLLGTQILVP